MGRVRDKVVAKQDICIPLQIPFLEWQRPKGQTFFFAETSTKVGLRLPSYCFLPLESSLNLLDHSDCPPVVTRSLLTAPKCHTSSRRCGGNRNGAINICQQTVDILSPPPPIYVAPSPHAFMFCWASDSNTGRPTPSRLRSRRYGIQICQSCGGAY